MWETAEEGDNAPLLPQSPARAAPHGAAAAGPGATRPVQEAAEPESLPTTRFLSGGTTAADRRGAAPHARRLADFRAAVATVKAAVAWMPAAAAGAAGGSSSPFGRPDEDEVGGDDDAEAAAAVEFAGDLLVELNALNSDLDQVGGWALSVLTRGAGSSGSRESRDRGGAAAGAAPASAHGAHDPDIAMPEAATEPAAASEPATAGDPAKRRGHEVGRATTAAVASTAAGPGSQRLRAPPSGGAQTLDAARRAREGARAGPLVHCLVALVAPTETHQARRPSAQNTRCVATSSQYDL